MDWNAFCHDLDLVVINYELIEPLSMFMGLKHIFQEYCHVDIEAHMQNSGVALH